MLVQFVGDAFVGEADELGERRLRPTGTARQRWDEAANRGPWVAIEDPQIDRLGRAAGRKRRRCGSWRHKTDTPVLISPRRNLRRFEKGTQE